MTPPVAVIGLDLSLAATGVATPAGVTTVGSSGHDTDTLRQRCVRLHNLTADILTAVYEGKPAGLDLLVVVEQPIMRARGKENRVLDKAGLFWLVVDALDGETGVDVVTANSSQRMVYATGKGQADKDTVLAAVIRRYPEVLVSNNNEADALVLRAMGCHAIGQPLALVPLTHRRALERVAWPDWIDLHPEEP